jgi:hypothetical protein
MKKPDVCQWARETVKKKLDAKAKYPKFPMTDILETPHTLTDANIAIADYNNWFEYVVELLRNRIAADKKTLGADLAYYMDVREIFGPL